VMIWRYNNGMYEPDGYASGVMQRGENGCCYTNSSCFTQNTEEATVFMRYEDAKLFVEHLYRNQHPASTTIYEIVKTQDKQHAA